MNTAFDPTLAEAIRKSGNIAVIVIEKTEDVAPLSRALLDGGIRAIELTFRGLLFLARLFYGKWAEKALTLKIKH